MENLSDLQNLARFQEIDLKIKVGRWVGVDWDTMDRKDYNDLLWYHSQFSPEARISGVHPSLLSICPVTIQGIYSLLEKLLSKSSPSTHPSNPSKTSSNFSGLEAMNQFMTKSEIINGAKKPIT